MSRYYQELCSTGVTLLGKIIDNEDELWYFQETIHNIVRGWIKMYTHNRVYTDIAHT